MSTVSLEVVKALVKLFVERFDNNELEDLAFSLGVNFDDISGNTRSAKARELALYLNRRSLMDELRQKGPVERPDLDWEAVFGGVTPPLTAGITGPEPVSYTHLDVYKRQPSPWSPRSSSPACPSAMRP